MNNVIDTVTRDTMNSYPMGAFTAVMMSAALNAAPGMAGRYVVVPITR